MSRKSRMLGMLLAIGTLLAFAGQVQAAVVRIEAEDMPVSGWYEGSGGDQYWLPRLTNDGVASNGGAYVQLNAGSMDFKNIVAPTAGTYAVTFRLKSPNGGAGRVENVLVNGTWINNTLGNTVTTNTWTDEVQNLDLLAGANTISITRSWGWFDVDYIEIDGVTVEEPVRSLLHLEAENGVLSGGGGWTGADPLASNGEYVGIEGATLTWTVNVPEAGDYDLVLGVAHGWAGDNPARAQDLRVNGTYTRLVTVPTTDTNWHAQVITGVPLVQGSNTIALSNNWGYLSIDYIGIDGLAAQDSDADGLTDEEEGILGTSPIDSDTDDDGISDGDEVLFNLNPLVNEGASLPVAGTAGLAALAAALAAAFAMKKKA